MSATRMKGAEVGADSASTRPPAGEQCNQAANAGKRRLAETNETENGSISPSSLKERLKVYKILLCNLKSIKIGTTRLISVNTLAQKRANLGALKYTSTRVGGRARKRKNDGSVRGYILCDARCGATLL